MSNTHDRRLARRRSHRRSVLLGTIAAIAVVGLSGFAIVRIASGGSANTTANTTAAATSGTSSMGMPIIATPGSATGTATASGVSAEPATWALGRVALDVAVRPNWTITNTGSDAVTIGEPHVQINEGCCPGDFTFQGPTTLDPGAETGLTFELSMHAGMDGPHDMTLHVPVTRADGATDTLDLTVTGDFRN